MFEEFLLIGLVLFAGFVAQIVFAKTKVSQVLILVALGFALGPIFGVVDASEGSLLAGLTPFVATLALIILLFDGGISLNVFEVLRVLPRATAFTVLVFCASVACTAVLAIAFFGWGLLEGVLLGAVIGGTSSAIVLAFVEKSRASADSKSLLALESTLTDSLCIITAFVVLQLIQSNVPVEATAVLNLLAGSFSIALTGAALAALAWLVALRRMNSNGFPAYMLTLATVFLLYSLVEAAKGSGGVAVFTFGLILGNAKRVEEALKVPSDYALAPQIASVQGEVTFFTRTFFFVFLGAILDLSGITQNLAAFSLAIVVLFFALRWLGCAVMLPGSKDCRFIASMLPRGLAAAVLASIPATEGLSLPGFREIALLVIILTNIIATAGVLLYKPSGEAETPPAQGAQAPPAGPDKRAAARTTV
ncbi:MAG: cation:proton antiporter [Candidatus ainarchaeum sp.]|nr:cation:proton antiporter [Candidatus ainarchaeum sp.]